MTSSERFDVIIIGGGPAGAAAAITLGHRTFRTAIIEKSAYRAISISHKNTETLAPDIRSLLASLGVWRQFLADGHFQSSTIRFAWGGPEPHQMNDMSRWHVDRVTFDRMLALTAKNVSSLLTEAHIKRLSQNHGADWEMDVLQHNQSRCMHAPFLIDATGRTSNPTLLWSSFHVVDRLISIGYIYPTIDEPYTLIEAEPRGWWYSAPLSHGRLVVTHMTDADLVASAGFNLREYWQRRLPEARLTYARARSCRALMEPKVVSAASRIRRPVFGADWLTAGDACVAFDPLTGSGIYNAVKGGTLAAKAIIANFDGNRKAFAEYAGWVNKEFSSYLHMRRVIYSKEQRWVQYPFWRRRHQEVHSLIK